MVAKDDLLCPCLPGRERVPATRKRVEPERVTVLAGAPYGPLRSRERRCFVVDRDHARTIRYDASERPHHGASSGLRILCERPPREDAEPGHGRQKPVEVMARPIRNHQTREVYEPFLGSGTTLIAAEQLGRRCLAIEIEPAYCDVVVLRWEQLTGEKAERARVPRGAQDR